MEPGSQSPSFHRLGGLCGKRGLRLGSLLLPSTLWNFFSKLCKRTRARWYGILHPQRMKPTPLGLGGRGKKPPLSIEQAEVARWAEPDGVLGAMNQTSHSTLRGSGG